MYVVQGTPPVTGLPGAAPGIGLPLAGSTFAAMAFQTGSRAAQASGRPPGISEGPNRAPSSPPSSGTRLSITASVAAPAFTMMTTRRGRAMEATKSGSVDAGTSAPPVVPKTEGGFLAMKRSVTSVVRLNTATRKAWSAMFRARF